MKIAEITVFENDDFIVLNKPSGLLSIPDRVRKEVSLKELLQQQYGEIFTVHRLDRGTSGLILFAKNENAHKFLSLQFEAHQLNKTYLGLVTGTPADQKGSIDLPIMEHPAKKGFMVVNRQGKESLTNYEVMEKFGIYSWVRFQIHTGRTHQIRVHMKEIGHPIVCDELYGDGKPVFLSSIKHNFKLSKNEEEERPLLKRLALHSSRLIFTGPDKNVCDFEAPLPKDLKAVLQQLEKRKKGFTDKTFFRD